MTLTDTGAMLFPLWLSGASIEPRRACIGWAWQLHNPTCYLRQSVERRRINVTGLNYTTFLKALYIQQPDLTHLTVSLCGYGLECCQKRKPSIELGFVKMGDKSCCRLKINIKE